MQYLLFCILILILVVATVLIKKRSRFRQISLPYQSRKTLFSPAERSFLGILDKILGEDCRIFAKTRLADIIDVQKGISASERQSAFNRISRKHLDFVICNANDLSITGAIELDDKSHRKEVRQKRDEFVDKALETAAVPILRIKAQSRYSIKEVSSNLESAFNINISSPQVERPKLLDGKQVLNQNQNTKAITNVNEKMIAPVCPKCGADLIKRTATKGKHAGRKFWGCSNFPQCRFVKS